MSGTAGGNVSPDLTTFRASVREWLADNLTGDFAALRGKGGSGREHECYEERVAWNKHLAAQGWTGLGWPEKHGGRGLSLAEQVVFYEEYARTDAPATVNHLGEQLVGPTLISLGSSEQQERFLPKILGVEELWCQGYSEPDAGSDLANVATKATLADGEWLIDGQKIWTSLAVQADWCFVIARTEPGSTRHHGLSYLLVPMDQPGVEVRPIIQSTGTSEFNEVFFTDARTDATMVVGEQGDGWRVAMATLGFERGVSTLGQQVGFARELDALIAVAKANGSFDDPIIRDRLAQAKVGVEVIREQALRTLSAAEAVPGADSITKLLWGRWHRDLGELAMAVRGADALTAASADGLDEWQQLFLFSRADTIYGGSDEVQRNILSERVLGLPREAR